MIDNSLFYEEELKLLPLTYYNMDKLKTKEVKEFNDNLVFGESERHSSKEYLITYPIKPFSNYVIDGK